MMPLLKYEIRKTWSTKLMVLGIVAVEELAFLCSLYLMGQNVDNWLMALSTSLLVMTTIGGILFIGISSVVTLHRDMNTKQGYMLYMTPRNSYQILGAKMMENGLSIVLAGAFFFALGTLDITLLFGRMGELGKLWEFVTDILRQINSDLELSAEMMMYLVANALASWLATVSVAYLADIISSALLNGKKFNGILTFILFILLTALLSWLQRSLVPAGSPFTTLALIDTAVALAYSVVMYVLSALVMEKYLSV